MNKPEVLMSNHKINAIKTASGVFFGIIILFLSSNVSATQTLMSNYDCGTGVQVYFFCGTSPGPCYLSFDGVNLIPIISNTSFQIYCEGTGHNASTTGTLGMLIGKSDAASNKMSVDSALTGTTNQSSGLSVVSSLNAISQITNSIYTSVSTTPSWASAYDVSLQYSYIFGFMLGLVFLVIIWKLILK